MRKFHDLSWGAAIPELVKRLQTDSVSRPFGRRSKFTCPCAQVLDHRGNLSPGRFCSGYFCCLFSRLLLEWRSGFFFLWVKCVLKHFTNASAPWQNADVFDDGVTNTGIENNVPKLESRWDRWLEMCSKCKSWSMISLSLWLWEWGRDLCIKRCLGYYYCNIDFRVMWLTSITDVRVPFKLMIPNWALFIHFHEGPNL